MIQNIATPAEFVLRPVRATREPLETLKAWDETGQRLHFRLTGSSSLKDMRSHSLQFWNFVSCDVAPQTKC
eukprot:COSAG01_NODE_552_length_15569_cov_37.676123_21_plen_71_part_00